MTAEPTAPMNWDFYIYGRKTIEGDDVTLHFSSCGKMQNHSCEGATIEAHDLKKAYDGFYAAYEFIWGCKYDR